MYSVRKSHSVKPTSRHGPHARLAAQQAVLAPRMLGVAMKFGAGTEIFGEGEPVDYVYEVVNGAVRTVQMLSDGRREIGGFYFAGDIFGLEDSDEHSFSAEAIAASTVRVIKRRTLIQLSAEDSKLTEELLAMAMREAARAHRHAFMLILTAQERVNCFLFEM